MKRRHKDRNLTLKVVFLRFVALVIHPDELSVVHGSLVGIAHVVVGSGVGKVQLLPEQVIFYFYCRVGRGIFREEKIRLFLC